jgi:endonuclease YncB( thermonuclease family)
VQITTVTLKRLKRALAAMLCVMALGVVAGCEQATSFIGQARGEARAQSAGAFQARVVGVTDGDSLTVLDEQNQQHRLRLAEIDAPERGQPWGNRSREALSALVFGKTISVQQTDTDRYGRVVARVFADGRDVNRAMVEQGHAWAYRQYLTDETLVAMETRARASRVGLWSMSDQQTVAPWEWRQGVRGGTGDQPTAARPQGLFTPAPRSAPANSNELFSCSGKRFCREMNSCAEAHFHLERCGVSSLDGNDDGEPCEMLCGTAGP